MPGNVKPPIWAPGLQASKPLAQGLVGYWPLWAGDGDTVMDLVGGNTGTLSDPATMWATGQNGPVVAFDGSNTLDFNDPVSFGASDPYTITWLMDVGTVTAGNGGIYRSGSTSNGGYFWVVAASSGKLWGRHDNTNVVEPDSGPVVANTGPHHIAVSWDGANSKLYFDGKLFSTKADTSGTDWGIYRIGRNLSEFIVGDLDSFAPYNRALTPSEITQLYDDQYQLITPPTQIWTPNAGGAPSYVPYPHIAGMTGGIAI